MIEEYSSIEELIKVREFRQKEADSLREMYNKDRTPDESGTRTIESRSGPFIIEFGENHDIVKYGCRVMLICKHVEEINKLNESIRISTLPCYGCCHSCIEGTPSGERPCQFCTRNNERSLNVKVWYDGSEPVKVPMDCYYSLDMSEQIYRWGQKKQKENKQ